MRSTHRIDNIWNGIYGQRTVKTLLAQFIESSILPHAFIFQGPEGVGKEFCAIRFAQAVNQANDSSENSISLIEQLQEPHVKYIVPLPRGKNETESNGPFEKLSIDDIQLIRAELEKKTSNLYYKVKIAKAQNIKLSSIKEIRRFLSMEYRETAYRLILISDAHLMNEESQNALLKNLEEPPPGILFILCTPYSNLLRETIRSRCWSINFFPLDIDDIKTILVEKFKIDPETAEIISPFAGGSITTALKLYEYDLKILIEKTICILRYSFGKKYHSALNEFTKIAAENNQEVIKLLISLILVWFNDIQKFRLKKENNVYFSNHIETFEKFNKKFPNVSVLEISRTMEKLNSIIQNNVNLNTIALNIVFELGKLTNMK